MHVFMSPFSWFDLLCPTRFLSDLVSHMHYIHLCTVLLYYKQVLSGSNLLSEDPKTVKKTDLGQPTQVHTVFFIVLFVVLLCLLHALKTNVQVYVLG